MRFLLSLLLVVLLFQSDDGKFNKETCTCKGKQLYGRVRVVDSNPDFRVRIVDGNEDLRVRVREATYSCGEWRITDGYADFTVQFVEYNPDFTIKFVDY